MATLRQKIRAEMKMRELLEENGMPEPDGVEYGHGCIRLFFDEPKVAVVIDIDEPPDENEAPPEGYRRSSAEVWKRDEELYDAEAEEDDGGYERGRLEPHDADLN
jgi:hypothetical protein